MTLFDKTALTGVLWFFVVVMYNVTTNGRVERYLSRPGNWKAEALAVTVLVGIAMIPIWLIYSLWTCLR